MAITHLFFDFDGVMTDNRVIIDEMGKESVLVNRSDGLGINMLKDMGIHSIIISTETNPVVSARAKKLNIEVIQSVSDKGKVIREYLEVNKISVDNTAYVGNDINDIPGMNEVGIIIVPNDAYDEVKEIADIILDTKGGYGVVREIAAKIKNKTLWKGI